jgi:hypothetical protein
MCGEKEMKMILAILAFPFLFALPEPPEPSLSILAHGPFGLPCEGVMSPHTGCIDVKDRGWFVHVESRQPDTVAIRALLRYVTPQGEQKMVVETANVNHINSTRTVFIPFRVGSFNYPGLYDNGNVFAGITVQALVIAEEVIQ